MMRTEIPVENGQTLEAIQGFLQQLLRSGIVEALLVPMRTPGGAVAPALVTDAALLVAADPLAPVLPNNSATLAGRLSRRQPRAKVGIVLRPCEARALVELVKVQQANLDDLTLIAVDCAGTYDVTSDRWRTTNGHRDGWRQLFQTAVTEPESMDAALRPACRMCQHPVYPAADITVELLGSDLERAISLSLPHELAEKLGFQATESTAEERTAVVDRLVNARTAVRDEDLAAIRARLENGEGLAGVFDACIRCHNCMTVCPICYCKTCVFKSPVFDHEPRQYLDWARQKGAYRLPADTMLFHLTRLNHMGLSCVGCGMCSQACPAQLPVGQVFQAIGRRLQDTFDYEPGRRLDEPLPLITFQEDEWTELGEEKI